MSSGPLLTPLFKKAHSKTKDNLQVEGCGKIHHHCATDFKCVSNSLEAHTCNTCCSVSCIADLRIHLNLQATRSQSQRLSFHFLHVVCAMHGTIVCADPMTSQYTWRAVRPL